MSDKKSHCFRTLYKHNDLDYFEPILFTYIIKNQVLKLVSSVRPGGWVKF